MQKSVEKRIRLLSKKEKQLSRELDVAYKLCNSDADLSLAKSRMVLEKIVKKIYSHYSDGEVYKGDLNSLLKNTVLREKIPSRIWTRMHSIRAMGNLGIHGSEINAVDAHMILENLCEITEWYLDSEAFGKKPKKKGPNQLVKPLLVLGTLACLAAAFYWNSGNTEKQEKENTSLTEGHQSNKEDRAYADLTGSWNMVMTTEETTFKPFEGLEVEFLIFITQQKENVEGQGEKIKENREELSGKQKTKLSFTGNVQDSTVVLNYTNFGAKRVSLGQISLKLNEDGELKGTHTASAANSKGPVHMTRNN